MNNERGISLVELMVSLVISSMLILGVLQLHLSTSSSDRANTALSRVQENGRIALELIGADARRAGFQGCVSSLMETQVTNAVRLPDHAVVSGTNSITFRYAVTDSTAGAQLPAAANGEDRSCFGVPQTYYLRTAAYTNCDGDLCLNGTPILAGAQITGVTYAVPNGANAEWKAAPTTTEIVAAKAVRISLRVNDASQDITRDLIGTYEFRNRTQ